MNTRYDPYYPTHYRRENIPDVPLPKNPPVSATPQSPQKDKVSVKSWMGTLLLSAIPVVNIICFFIWAFGTKAKPSKKTFAAASIIWMVIAVILIAVVVVVGLFVFKEEFSAIIDNIKGMLQ